MHELAICQDLIAQLQQLATEHHAQHISAVVLEIGALSGVEVPLLTAAYSIASAGTVAANAQLTTELSPIIVHCQGCGKNSSAKANRLICGHCGDFHTQVISGEQMILKHVEMECD